MTSQRQQVIVRPTSNDDVREYHLGEQIIEAHTPYMEFFSTLYDSGSQSSPKGHDIKGKKIADQLMDKRHEKVISRSTFRPFSVRVYKTPTADWATVESSIVLPALKSALGSEITFLQYGSSKARDLALAGANA